MTPPGTGLRFGDMKMASADLAKMVPIFTVAKPPSRKTVDFYPRMPMTSFRHRNTSFRPDRIQQTRKPLCGPCREDPRRGLPGRFRETVLPPCSRIIALSHFRCDGRQVENE